MYIYIYIHVERERERDRGPVAELEQVEFQGDARDVRVLADLSAHGTVVPKRGGGYCWTEILLPRIARQGAVRLVSIRGQARTTRIEKFELEKGFPTVSSSLPSARSGRPCP